MSTPYEAVAKYIDALVASRDRTTRSEDRLEYTKHLAAAAEMSAAAQRGHLTKLLEIIATEERYFGWSYLSGNAGASAERAFHDLATAVRSLEGAGKPTIWQRIMKRFRSGG